MPTARELLEQADALMRRNRGIDLPRNSQLGPAPPTPTYAPTISPRTIQREPIASSIIEVPPPAATEQPASVAPREPEDGDVPLLTDAVPEAGEAQPTSQPAIDDAVADDVPLLTDAVEEIDMTVVDEAAIGEPSHWELTTGDASVLDPVPDAIAVAPESHDTSAPRAVDPAGMSQKDDEVATSDPFGLDQPVHDLPDGDEQAAQSPEQAFPPDAREAAEVRASAEEIGMQVLQRIDILSDTELRSQLRERLKPTVDRVSAELATEINRHVGELVRACIAEAIDREIESWRKGGR